MTSYGPVVLSIDYKYVWSIGPARYLHLVQGIFSGGWRCLCASVNSKAMPATAKLIVQQPMWDRFQMSCQTKRRTLIFQVPGMRCWWCHHHKKEGYVADSETMPARWNQFNQMEECSWGSQGLNWAVVSEENIEHLVITMAVWSKVCTVFHQLALGYICIFFSVLSYVGTSLVTG